MDRKEIAEVKNGGSTVQGIENKQNEERIIGHAPGMPILLLTILLGLASIPCIVFGAIRISWGLYGQGVPMVVGAALFLSIIMPFLIAGLKVIRPNEAYVFTLFGKYAGSLKTEGFFFVNPFVSANNPMRASAIAEMTTSVIGSLRESKSSKREGAGNSSEKSNKISLKAIALNNEKQKINDLLGNPIEIGIVVIWRVVNTAKAVFNVDNFQDYLSIQCDSALRNTVRLYPYDITDEEGGSEGETSLRGSSSEIAHKLKEEIQSKVDIAGLEVIEARITHLAYAPEIAAAMLRRQQASAIVDARRLIVQGAVGMVQQALAQLENEEIIDLDEERKAQMVSNLLVVLCGNKDAQPIVNSGSLY